ncbi:hypothetical protein HMPREF1554_00712 [Porphyromonas gingivalis F0569]|uniref:Uncharacterized protein n=1 Tax=Porphyromonas gingivalis F0570 TaxID=1227271 RepID=A0A0E2LQ16_PORGN|nr:hypothetical protein HMPREF1555_01227 [Porphyromonas gingivalis F0570]ERJ67147.1 hypothetical protein HMPREF1553_01612 [Porphyromonas gingivalis F0568]ERJ69248.1 hypothetical protein HMPREF1554_00712 [Porphyromonas gingivalis F0569]ERJ84236.1 hypothetical protein HMPREF1988_00821 [Porphyromonas gingivalis F0185]ERJ87657.1 hypothetical protein HMPREF1989_00581 [Porphyromonas gingivalis F0566]
MSRTNTRNIGGKGIHLSSQRHPTDKALADCSGSKSVFDSIYTV